MSILAALLWTIGIMGFMTAATWGLAPDIEAPRHKQANAPVRLSRWWRAVLEIEAILAGVGLVWVLQMPFGLSCVAVLFVLIGEVGILPLSGLG